jgi:flagellar hook-associated protein 1 FlgK
MSNTFSGLEIARRAMSYFRQGIETAGHNISNADVEGYSRQRVEASPTTPFTAPGMNGSGQPGQIGTGVGIDAISRIRSEFLDAQFRQESIEGGYWEAVTRTMDYLEMFVGEPSESGLSSALDTFNQALQEFQKRPDSASTRENLLQEADNFCHLLGQIESNFSEFRASLNDEIALKVEEANDLIDRIAALNSQIKTVQAMGNTPNDLMDQRDLLVEQLARLANIAASYSSQGGDFIVSLDGKHLVQGQETRHLVLVPQEGNGGFYDVQVEGNLFKAVDKPEVAECLIERGATEGIHSLEVERLASQTRWAVGTDTGGGYESASNALGMTGGFSLQVGTSGLVATSREITGGIVLDDPSSTGAPTSYAFRVAAGETEKVIQIEWDETNTQWTIDGTGVGGNQLTLQDLANYVNNTTNDVPAVATVEGEKISFENPEGHLLSFTDIEGDLISKLGVGAPTPKVDIEVTEADSLQTIANKINSAFGSEDGSPDEPGEWLTASVEEATDGTFYLSLESRQVGENYRINVGSMAGKSMSVAESLRLVGDDDGTRVLTYAQDARFSVDGMTYLSSVNEFSEARPVTSSDDYRTDTMQTVLDGVHFKLNGTGSAEIRVERHLQNGYIAGLLSSRDDVIVGMLEFLDNFAKIFSDRFNAVHASGHGTGANSGLTGTNLFEPLLSPAGAASSLRVNGDLLEDSSLLSAAAGDGTGHSSGSGDGTIALELVRLFEEPIFNEGSATIDDHYLSFVSSLGSQSRQSAVMNENQQTLLGQIDTQRQSISGVNIDEEMMDLVQYQQSYKAISRYVTVLDELLDTVISRMGITGR